MPLLCGETTFQKSVAPISGLIFLSRPDAQSLGVHSDIKAGKETHPDQTVGSIAIVILFINLNDHLHPFRFQGTKLHRPRFGQIAVYRSVSCVQLDALAGDL